MVAISKSEALAIQRLGEANDRLRQARVGISIQRSGGRLRLRGQFPDENGELARRYISRGTRFGAIGVREMERLAHHLRELMSRGEFRLEDWRLRKSQPRDRTARDWIEDFEADYFRRRRRTPKSETTFRTEFLASFRKLDLGAPLSADALLEAVFATEPDSRTRQRVCLCLGRLAVFAGLEIDLSEFRGSYSAKSVNPRTLPTVEEIVSALLTIPSIVWRKVALLIYVYGLRNHEVFYLVEFDGDAAVISDGKTGGRVVFPCNRDLSERFELRALELPQCSGRTNGDLGHRVTTQFRRYGLPFRPYDLRHCYARELHEAGATAMFAAKMMGHSVKVHEGTYSQWWGLESLQRQYATLNL